MLLAFLRKIPIQWGCVSFISTPTYRTGVEFLFFTRPGLFCLHFLYQISAKKKKKQTNKKKQLLSCVSWPQGWAFGTTFPRALVSAEFSTCSCLPWTKITFPKPMWHSWMLLKLWVGAEQGIKSTQSPAVSRSESTCICTSVCNSLKRICLLQVRMQWNSIEYCLRGDYCHGDVGVTLFKVLVEPALGFTHTDWWEGNQGRETGEAGSWQQAWGDSGGDYNRTSSRWVPQQRSDWGG